MILLVYILNVLMKFQLLELLNRTVTAGTQNNWKLLKHRVSVEYSHRQFIFSLLSDLPNRANKVCSCSRMLRNVGRNWFDF